MRDELKAVMKEVRRNEAIIEYMELMELTPYPFKRIGDVVHTILSSDDFLGGEHEQPSA